MLSSRFAVAVHVLAVQAVMSDRVLTSDFLAGSVNTNPVVVRRILGMLRRAGLVVVQPGPGGGSRLAKPPNRIRLAEVYRAVEKGELLALHKSPPSRFCPVGRNIGGVLAEIFCDAEGALEKALEKRSLDEVAAAIKKCAAAGK
ncbi:MAG TPA: Rrf2 family transcriptional regulator [Vicinamibacteria bacterium]|nr:Rrf2 family transcriptional regulator [Vicinamibacteria bacterium]